jgi:hypothetical protein
MNNPIAKLEQVATRLAWAHEANDFTPWLAGNLELLSEAVGIKLELEGTEVSVDAFSADILARNVYDDSRVLIENQLESSDHSHLGQILTYLAGLEANTIIWIASDFREPHLSAINWLNSNTDDSISFFAIKLKVVRIGDSPYAPVFDVMARPNNWEKRLHKNAPKSGESSPLALERYEFWHAYVDRIPDELEKNGPASYTSNRWIKLDDIGLVVSLLTATDCVGLFIRGPYGVSFDEVYERLRPHAEALTEKLGVECGTGLFFQSVPGNYKDESQRDESINWLNVTARSALFHSRVLLGRSISNVTTGFRIVRVYGQVSLKTWRWCVRTAIECFTESSMVSICLCKS